MYKILVALGCLISGSALAADLGSKLQTKAPPAPAAVSPLYLFVQGGGAFTSTQSDIAIAGVAMGTPKVWPAGPMFGGGIGYLTSTSPLTIGGEVEANYNFMHSGVGCMPGLPCLGEVKNSWFFAEKALLGFTLPSYGNVTLLAAAGLAQRNINLSAIDIATGASSTGEQWKNGFLVGPEIRFPITPNLSLRAAYHYVDFSHGQTFTPAQSIPLFANTTAAKDEQRIVGGVDFHF